MDLLFHEYASPFIFIDEMIRAKRFGEFVLEFMKLDEEKRIWELYLYKVFDKSYIEFKESLTANEKLMPKEQLETTVTTSRDILVGFVPTGRGENIDGAF